MQRTLEPRKHLHRDWAHPCHICAGTLPTCHICTKTGHSTPATSAPGLDCQGLFPDDSILTSLELVTKPEVSDAKMAHAGAVHYGTEIQLVRRTPAESTRIRGRTRARVCVYISARARAHTHTHTHTHTL